MSAMRTVTATEAKLFSRDVGNLFFALVFPGMLLAILGLAIPEFTNPLPELGGDRIVDVYLPVVIGMAIATVGISTLPSYIATYREKGVLRRFQTTPLGAGRLLTAQVIVQAVVVLFAILLAMMLGMVLFDIGIPSNVPAAVLAAALSLLGVAAVGVLIAALAPSARVANGISMLVFFPLLVVAGVWTPGPEMPDLLARIGELTPVGAGVQGLQAAFAGDWPSTLQMVVPLVWAAVAGGLAARFFRWG